MPEPAVIDYAAWRFWIDVGHMILTAAVWAYVWWSNREKVTAKRFNELEKDVSERLKISDWEAKCALHIARTSHIESAITRFESDMKHAPSHENLGRIHSRLDEMTEKIGTMNGSLKGIGRAVDLINQHLIDKGA